MKFMNGFKKTLLALLVFLVAFVVRPCAAEIYIHPERIYSFQYPKSWIIKKYKSSDMVWFAPSVEEGGAFCFSRPEKMTGDSGEKKVEDFVKTNLEKGVLQEAIRAADPQASKFEAEMFNKDDIVASKIIYESKDNKGAVKKVTMILTYNLDTGHTIDITCGSPVSQWHKYAEIFEEIQSSLRIYDQFAIRAMEGPDFVGNKKELVLGYLSAIRKRITLFRLRDGSNVPPETAEELSRPLLPYEDAKRVVNRGVLSGMAEHCGLDWQNKSFTPFMRNERAKGVWSDKNIAVIGALHGVAQSNTLEGLQRKGKCTAEFSKKTQSILNKLRN